uniref:Deoxynucleoside kinase domain-containing protein n=1 Tax=viral metagenome TaxID=1070528 RepID=A0A6C0D7R5_9ZZZZ
MDEFKKPSYPYPIFASIEGNIGSGKSTLLSNLKNHFKNDNRIVFIKEPVDEWAKIRDSQGSTMLEKFYQDQSKYAFSFQMMAYISRLSTFKTAISENPQATIFITERSLDTDKYVFARMLFDDFKIEDVNYQIYNTWFELFANEYPIHKIIYVKTDPEICYERISKRSRTGEDCIPIDYLKKCDYYHDDMMSTKYKNHQNILIDGNVDIYTDETILKTWLQAIEHIIFN